MLKKTISYDDYNGVQRTEDFYFNLSEAELTEMELSTEGGLQETLNRIVAAKDMPSLVKIFKELIFKSYGEKSPDGKQFVKVDKNGVPLSVAFSQTEAYSLLFMELASDAKAAAEFANGVIPSKLKERIEKTNG